MAERPPDLNSGTLDERPVSHPKCDARPAAALCAPGPARRPDRIRPAGHSLHELGSLAKHRLGMDLPGYHLSVPLLAAGPAGFHSSAAARLLRARYLAGAGRVGYLFTWLRTDLHRYPGLRS